MGFEGIGASVKRKEDLRFLSGRGNYTEADVRAAARAFTGHGVRDGRFHFHGFQHDAGDKQLFGSSGPFRGDDVVALAVARPESAAFVAEKLLRFFVLPEPEPAEVALERYLST